MRVAPFTHKIDGSPCWTVNCSRNRPRQPRIPQEKINNRTSLISKYGTEQVGLATEIAIADIHAVPIAADYRKRTSTELTNSIIPALTGFFETKNVPLPISHIALNRNPIDFLLLNGKTLSVKSNMRDGGKIAPQNIGQPSSKTFWKRFPNLAQGFNPDTISYEESKKRFKQLVFDKKEILLKSYWENLFDTDYMIYINNVLEKNSDTLTNKPNVFLYEKSQSPDWSKGDLSFSKTLTNWNESCTIRYNKISIGEWQVHNNRDNFKFRFNIQGLIKAKLLR